jgi:hypothetical protein
MGHQVVSITLDHWTSKANQNYSGRTMMIFWSYDLGVLAHPSTNTEWDTTESTFTCFPQMITWSTSPGMHTIRIWKISHDIAQGTKDIPHKVPFWVLRTPKHQHWRGHKRINFHLFPTTDSFKNIPGLYPSRICKRKYVLIDEANNVTHYMQLMVLSTPKHQHWRGHNWITFHLFPTNDSSKDIPKSMRKLSMEKGNFRILQ